MKHLYHEHIQLLETFESPFPKQRYGSKKDGGYVIANIPNFEYDLLLSGGISTNVSFENEILETHSIPKCIALDGTIAKLPPQSNSKIEWVKKNIGAEENENTTNCKTTLHEHNAVLFKFDIEKAEYPLLQTLDEEELLHIVQMTFEIHHLNMENISILEKVNKHHTLIHTHANNNSGFNCIHGVPVPQLLELTYLRNDFFPDEKKRSKEPIPHPELDYKNIAAKPEILLNYYPFTTYQTL
jgi:hypothetical protein